MGNLLTTRGTAGKRITFPHALMSHRGGSCERIENTLPAFRRSANVLRVDLLEMDIYMTRDGECVIFHDSDLGRLCGLPERKISDYNYNDLPPLLIPDHLKNVKEVINDPESTIIPKLEKLLVEYPDYPMQIDVKEGTEAMVVKVGDMILKHGREECTVWGSFRSDVNDLCYKHFGTRIPLFFSWQRWLRSYLLSYVGLTAWMRYRESALILPDWPIVLRKSWFKELNRLGITVIVWGGKKDVPGAPGGGINTPDGWNRVNEAGVNGICTDSPEKLKGWLSSNSLTPFCPK